MSLNPLDPNSWIRNQIRQIPGSYGFRAAVRSMDPVNSNSQNTYDYGYVPNIYDLGTDPSQYPNGAGPVPTGSVDSQIASDNTVQNQNTGGGAGTTTTPNMQFWNGQMYDLNNQDQALAYTQAQDAFYGNAWNQYQTQSGDLLKSDLSTANRDYLAQRSAIQKSLTGVDTGEAQTLQDLQEGYGLGTVNRQNYFGNLSPNAYQSAQGSSQAYSLGKLNEGSQQTTAAADLNRTDLNATMADTGAAYNDYMSQRQTQEQQSLASQQQKINSARETGMTNFGNAAQTNGWDMNAFTPSIDYAAPQVDMSKFTPYLNFQQLSQAPGQAAYGKVLGQQTTQPGSQSVNQYLNYTPNKKPYDSLNSYLSYGR